MTKLQEKLDAMGVLITPTFIERTKDGNGWEHFAWNCILGYQGCVQEFKFRTGIGKVGKTGKATNPSTADLVYCLLGDAQACEQSHAAWCSDLGYNVDSRKALALYLECQACGEKLAHVIPRTMWEELRNLEH